MVCCTKTVAALNGRSIKTVIALEPHQERDVLDILLSLAPASTSLSDSSSAVISTSGAQSSHIASFASMIGGLIVVIAIIFVLAYIVKRLNLVPSQHSIIKSVAVTALGQKEKVVLIEVNGQQYLLGITSQQITLIDKLAEKVTVESETFAQRLRQAKEDK
jgi:flagellar protein FliO/FliZ